MAVYYFDLRDGETLAVDEEGLELRNMGAVREEAARALAGFAWTRCAWRARKANG